MRAPYNIEKGRSVFISSDIHSDLEKFMFHLYNAGIINTYYTTNINDADLPQYTNDINTIINVLANFEVTQTFFEELTHLQLEKGGVKIQLELEKKETMILAFFSAIGDVQQACCLCNDLVNVNVNTELSIIYKLGIEES